MITLSIAEEYFYPSKWIPIDDALENDRRQHDNEN